MDAAKFGEFHQQIKRNQDELTGYLKELDSWKQEISKKDSVLLSGVDPSKSNGDDTTAKLPPVRNSLHKKKKVKRRKPGQPEKQKKAPIPGHDFRAWDKFDVDKALEDVENDSHSSSYDESTDEEWEEERRKQQAVFEKEQGNDYFKKQKFDEAIQCYTRGVNCDPSNAVLYANRAMALMKQEKYGAVIQDCTDAIALDPTYIKAYMRRGTARRKLNKLEEALGDFRQIKKLSPDDKLAQREIASLEQELRISAEGIVLPIKKPLKDRSKKPLVRIDIEEIDHDEVKTKLNEAVAKTTASQSAEKKRIVAQDSEMFNQFVTRAGGDSTASDAALKSTLTTKPSRKIEVVASSETPIQSPADIGKSSMTKVSQNGNKPVTSPADIGKLNLTSVTKSAADNSPQQSPNTSPRAPINSYQFQRDWKSVKHDIEEIYKYLQLIPPTDYAKMIGEFLEADVMTALLDVFLNRFLRDGINVSQHLVNLGKVKRFAMIIMFMSKHDKSVMKNITDALAKMEDTSDGDLQKIKKLYDL